MIRLAELPLGQSFTQAVPDMAQPWTPQAVPAPALEVANTSLAASLGIDPASLDTAAGVAVLAGAAVPPGASPVAQAYSGHQFGGFSPRLGDGRAALLGDWQAPDGRRVDLALKGSGRTPFARGGDGKAALGPMLREWLVSEAMHALGIPTTRALAVASTGERIWRDQPLPGAVLCRVAASHLRVGSFQYAAAWGGAELVRDLAEHAIERHDPDLQGRPDRFHALLQRVAARQAALVARWMGVGFIHGVMNTDNMTISGETIDYGPCAFMEAYGPRTVFSSIDAQGRYAYGNQPLIARWNLARLAEPLLGLLDDDEARAMALATGVVDAFPAAYRREWLATFCAKMGWRPAEDVAGDEADEALIQRWLSLLHRERVDFTLAFRALLGLREGDAAGWHGLWSAAVPDDAEAWLGDWRAHGEARGWRELSEVRRANPLYIPRNHQVEAALEAAQMHGDLAPAQRLLAVLAAPFDARPADAAYAEAAPAEATACYQTFCGT